MISLLDLYEVSFFIEELKSLVHDLGFISYSHVNRYHNFLANALRKGGWKSMRPLFFFLLMRSGFFCYFLVM